MILHLKFLTIFKQLEQNKMILEESQAEVTKLSAAKAELQAENKALAARLELAEKELKKTNKEGSIEYNLKISALEQQLISKDQAFDHLNALLEASKRESQGLEYTLNNLKATTSQAEERIAQFKNEIKKVQNFPRNFSYSRATPASTNFSPNFKNIRMN
jgi:chromosome segregation ATPase